MLMALIIQVHSHVAGASGYVSGLMSDVVMPAVCNRCGGGGRVNGDRHAH